jgi:hypothetical protein
MRTTLTLDPDVAVLVERARESTKSSLKEVVNQALRKGLGKGDDPRSAQVLYVTRAASLGECLLPDLDDVAGALAAAEGEEFR